MEICPKKTDLEPDQHRWYQVPAQVVSASVKFGSTLISYCHQRPSLAALTSVSLPRKQSWVVGMLRWRQLTDRHAVYYCTYGLAACLADSENTTWVTFMSQHLRTVHVDFFLLLLLLLKEHARMQPNGAPTTLLTTAATQYYLRNSQVLTGHRMGAAPSFFLIFLTTTLLHKKTCTSERKRSVFTHKPSAFKWVLKYASHCRQVNVYPAALNACHVNRLQSGVKMAHWLCSTRR